MTKIKDIHARLHAAGLRATPKRIAIGELLFGEHDIHVTADDVAEMARNADIRVSLATVYNTLNQFVSAGILKRITLDTDRTYFDTNITDHHHIYFEGTGELHDIPGNSIHVQGLPPAPAGSRIQGVDIVVRMS